MIITLAPEEGRPSISRDVVLPFLFLVSLAQAGCAPSAPTKGPAILLFTGTGTSANDVAALEAILRGRHLEYATVSSRQLNEMNVSQLRSYQLIVVPGGNFLVIGDGLTRGATANVHDAVQRGVNYLGICAGAFLAGNAPSNSLNLTAGARFGFYSAEKRGIRKAALPITGVNASPVEHYWEDGPELTGWGVAVGKYPDGTPAIVEGASGRGWVVLSGVHPEAPESWRRGMAFATPASSANAYAGMLIEAALHGTSLPHY